MGMSELFKLSQARRKILKAVDKKLKRPPAPNPTRWGKWLEAAIYYANEDTREKIIKVLDRCIDKETTTKKGVTYVESLGNEGSFFIVFTVCFKILENH